MGYYITNNLSETFVSGHKMKILLLIGSVIALGLANPTMGNLCFFNEKMYTAGETFMDGCSTCTCNEGDDVSCDFKLCAPCHYLDSNSGQTMRAWGPFHNGCSDFICTHTGLALCAEPQWCPHMCHMTNEEGVQGWVNFGTTVIEMPKEEGGCPKVCICKENEQWLGAASYECEEKCD